MKFQLATFGSDIIVEAIGIDAASFQTIKEALPTAVQANVIGYRQVASVTADRRAT